MAFVSLLQYDTENPIVLSTTQIVAFGTDDTSAPYSIWVRAMDGKVYSVWPIDINGVPIPRKGFGQPVNPISVVEQFKKYLVAAEETAQRAAARE